VAAAPAPDPARAGARGDAFDDLLLARVRVAVAGRYDGLREIGRGGMAVVYAARDRRLDRDVAIKVLPPELAFRADVRARFVREAQTAARLTHPGIVPIYAVDEADGLVFFVMALVAGESLAARLAREPRPPLAFVRQLLAQVADALAYAHRAGVVHRDVKPDNILLEHATGRAVVTDFGIAQAAEAGARLTRTGIAIGTPAFMSPEQAVGQRDVDGRSDLYALGLVGYLMLAGRLPFEADSSAGLLQQHVLGTPFPLLNFRPDLPFALADDIMRAIARDPDARWPDAAAFAAAVRAGGTGEGEAADHRVAERIATEHRVSRTPARDDPAAGAAVRASVVDALERMNASLAAAGEQLQRGREAAAGAVPPLTAAPLGVRAPHAMAGGAPAPAARRAGAGGEPPPSDGPARVARARALVRSWKRRLAWTAGASAAALASLLVGVTIGEEVLLVPWAIGGLLAVGHGVVLLRRTVQLRRVGIGVGDAFGDRWTGKLAALDPRPRAERLRDEVAALADADVLATTAGRVLHEAVDDRSTIRETWAVLGATDRQLVPDMLPTADALLERIVGLATTLARLEGAVPADALPALDARIAAARAAVASEDTGRRLTLLERQRASLAELAARQGAAQERLERATLALRSLRLDALKLRALGVDAAVADGALATQEARAIGRAVDRALEAADELRRL
jgi:hypothetical protein